MSESDHPWPAVPLEQLASEMCLGKMLDKNKNRGTLQPYLRNVNVRWFAFDLDDLKEMRFEPGEEVRFGLRSGDLVICEGGEPGRAAVWKGQAEDAKIQKALHRVRFHPGTYDPSFAMYYLFFGTITNRFAQYYTGTTIKHLTGKALSRVGFPLPPFNEQLRIVAKIEELLSDLDAGVAALKRAKANLKRYRAAVLKAAVEGKLTEEWRAKNPPREPAAKLLERILKERRKKWEENQLAAYEAHGRQPPKNWRDKYQEPAGPDTANLPALPEGWRWASIGQCFEVHVGATPSRSEDSYWNGPIPWVSSGEVQFCRITATRESITEVGLANSSTQINPVGSVLLGMIGEGRTRGQVAILDIPACNNQNCAAIWVSQTPVIPQFIYHWLWSQYEVTRTRGSGNNQPALNKSRVESIIFPLAPLEEQEQIGRELDEKMSIVDRIEHCATSDSRRASRLRQSILKRAFEGKLVPQDPTDEPASALLERIKTVATGSNTIKNSRKSPGTIRRRSAATKETEVSQ